MISRVLFGFALALSAHAVEISPTIFDMPPEAGVTIRAEAFEDMIPVSLFSVRKDMDAQQLTAALADCRFTGGDPEPNQWIEGQTPQRCHFEGITVWWENQKIKNVSIVAMRLPPTKERLLDFVKELSKLLGKPVSAYRESKNGNEQPLSLILEWRKGTDTLQLSMSHAGGRFFMMKFDYYPGPDKPSLERINARRPAPLPDEPLDKRMADFIEAIDFLPPIPLPEGEREMLAACSEFGGILKKSRDWKVHYLPFRDRLYEALGKHYADFKPRERYARLLRIAEGKEPGFNSGEVQVGAAHFLGSHDDPAVIDFLLAGMEVELPSGVEMECAVGIARQSTGEIMDRVLSMLEIPGQSQKTITILSKMETAEQLKELKEKARKVSRPIRSRLGAVIDYLEDHQSKE